MLIIENPAKSLVDRYFEIVANDSYETFGELITDDCTFSLMPIGRTFHGRTDVMAFVQMAGGRRAHDQRSRVTITNWFAADEYLVVEYAHRAIINPFRVRITIDGYCWIFHIRDGKFDAIREYINPSKLSTGLLLSFVMRIAVLLKRLT
jgi:ketosteroid isomerase-like protein